MDHTALVGVIDRASQLLDERRGLVARQRVAVEPLLQASTRDQFQRQVGPPVVGRHLVNLDDVRMLQSRRRLGLGTEAVQRVTAGVGAGQDHLQRHMAIERQLPCLVDHTHAAAAELALDFIARQSWRSGLAPRPAGIIGGRSRLSLSRDTRRRPRAARPGALQALKTFQGAVEPRTKRGGCLARIKLLRRRPPRHLLVAGGEQVGALVVVRAGGREGFVGVHGEASSSECKRSTARSQSARAPLAERFMARPISSKVYCSWCRNSITRRISSGSRSRALASASASSLRTASWLGVGVSPARPKRLAVDESPLCSATSRDTCRLSVSRYPRSKLATLCSSNCRSQASNSSSDSP